MKKITIRYLFILLLPATLASSASPKAQLQLKSSGVSEQDLLGAKTALFASPLNRALAQSTLSQSKTLNVMAIRVEFQEDSKSTTTGNGKFDLNRSSELAIDPTPHNRRYFESQLQALSNYFKSVSNDKLIITGFDSQWGDIYPVDSDRAYQLPHDISYYGPDEDPALKDKRLAELFRDAFSAADAANEIEFSRYQCFIIFHAGVGADFIIDYDETPNDVSSAFLNLSDLRENIDDGSITADGLQVHDSGGAFFIKEGIILPEMQSQIGVEIGLLGTAAILFGAQIGLPNLFDTETGRAGIGVWGLMDQGSGNYQGLIPAQPCAWSKVFLGWEQPVLLMTSQTRVSVAAALADASPKILKIPINADEYFLIENRQRYVKKNREIAIAYDENGAKAELEADGTIVHRAEDTLGVLVSIDEYDFGLPWGIKADDSGTRLTQPGILIWHIDEKVIREKYAENKVNADPEHRGVALMEAHGAKDLGQNYGFLHPASGSENGIIQNAFWDDNQSHKIVNDSEEVAFTPTTRPSSRANSGANSRIYITNFSASNAVMTFDFLNDWYLEGFPQTVSRLHPIIENSLVWGDIDGDDTTEIFAATANGRLYAWHADGRPLLNSRSTELVPTYNDKIDTVTLALFGTTTDSIISPPALVDLDRDKTLEIVLAAKNGQVYAWHARDADNDFSADPVANYPLAVGVDITAGPLILNDQIIIGAGNGALFSIQNGAIQWQMPLKSGTISGLARYGETASNQFVAITAGGSVALLTGKSINWTSNRNDLGEARFVVVGDLNRSGTDDIFVCFSSGKILAFSQQGTSVFGFTPISLPVGFSAPALGDIDGDGYGEIVFVSGDKIHAFHHNGRLVDNFPVDLAWGSGAPDCQYASPVMGDIDGDQDIELLIGASESQVIAYHHTGNPVSGFPLSTSAGVRSSVGLLNLGDETDLCIVALSDDGYLYVWDMPEQFDSKHVPWAGYLNGARRSARLGNYIPIQTSAGELMPQKSVYNYPNPTEGNSTTIRYHLNAAARINIKIYDLAGELVDEFEGPGMAQLPNEITWQLDTIQSGVYFARVEAEGASGTSVAIIKIAVVK
ncbi:T9SS type A sorting domain-containing protein [candidate division KSB1 bacterium]|nr:T9SS type A sorting domain-containing protein [candidate division KSB1 bacterium]